MAQRYPDEYGQDFQGRDSRELTSSFEVIPQAKHENFRRCRLHLPAILTIQCYCEDTARRHNELLRIEELPETVRDLKQLISDKLQIPIICQLQLSVKEMILFDYQSLSQDVSLRGGDQLQLIYFGRCSSDKLGLLVKQGHSISRFCKIYLNSNTIDSRTMSNPIPPDDDKKSKSKSRLYKIMKGLGLKEKKKISPQRKRYSSEILQDRTPSPLAYTNDELMSDANRVKWCLNYMYSNILLPWRDEGTLCQRLYLVQEGLLDKIIQVWQWSIDNSDYDTTRACMLTLWDFGENWAERVYLLNRGVLTISLNVFLDPLINCEETKEAALGLIAGFGEFSQGQKVLGKNDKFLRAIANLFCTTSSPFMATVIGGLVSSLASCHFVPSYMLNAHILETLKPDIDQIEFKSVNNLDMNYTLILFFMYLLKSPVYIIPKEYEVQNFVDYFEDFYIYNTDQSIADSEEEKQTSWASMVPFLDLLFVSNNSPVRNESIHDNKLLTAYLKCAKLLLSAMLLQEENRRLFLDEDLYGYLIYLSWNYKNDRLIGPFMLQLVARFQPPPFRIPTLVHLATAEYAFCIKGLGEAIEIVRSESV
ncbi:hypothetical protein LOD99_12616 [Oopsacas minuta]|uniref:Ubiquitin-like domain-containing protein n=1 Tax=Oopsacas minuta TaxID=111878 RepID=A0AAV7JCQ2_9METZ|nr:hypothetical protein LOD99_12616 [Oopsacas minuta]